MQVILLQNISVDNTLGNYKITRHHYQCKKCHGGLWTSRPKVYVSLMRCPSCHNKFSLHPHKQHQLSHIHRHDQLATLVFGTGAIYPGQDTVACLLCLDFPGIYHDVLAMQYIERYFDVAIDGDYEQALRLHERIIKYQPMHLRRWESGGSMTLDFE